MSWNSNHDHSRGGVETGRDCNTSSNTRDPSFDICIPPTHVYNPENIVKVPGSSQPSDANEIGFLSTLNDTSGVNHRCGSRHGIITKNSDGWLWDCHMCGDGPHSVAVILLCTNTNCQHVRCNFCSVYAGAAKEWAKPFTVFGKRAV